MKVVVSIDCGVSLPCCIFPDHMEGITSPGFIKVLKERCMHMPERDLVGISLSNVVLTLCVGSLQASQCVLLRGNQGTAEV